MNIYEDRNARCLVDLARVRMGFGHTVSVSNGLKFSECARCDSIVGDDYENLSTKIAADASVNILGYK